MAVDGDTTQENAEGMTVGRGAEPDLGEEIAKYPKKISTKSLDADKVGNETRYLNHKEVANTDVKSKSGCSILIVLLTSVVRGP